MKIKVHCKGCGLDYKITEPELELQFQMGRDDFYCNTFCYGNFITGSYYIYEYRNCIKEDCLSLFSVKPSSPKLYCSRGCASANSVTDYRREKAKEHINTNLAKGRKIESIANSLRTREMWKYKEIEEILMSKRINHLFEFPLERFVFDLALMKSKCFIEFDSKYHNDERQVEVDKEKEALAGLFKWKVCRIITDFNSVIPGNVILPYI